MQFLGMKLGFEEGNDMLGVHASARNCEIVEHLRRRTSDKERTGARKEERKMKRQGKKNSCLQVRGASAWRACFFEGRTYDRRCRSPCTNPAEAAEIDL